MLGPCTPRERLSTALAGKILKDFSEKAAKSDSNEIPKNIPPQEDMSNESELKLGRNDKVELIAPSGERVKVKFKKIDQYLMKGYTRG